MVAARPVMSNYNAQASPAPRYVTTEHTKDCLKD